MIRGIDNYLTAYQPAQKVQNRAANDIEEQTNKPVTQDRVEFSAEGLAANEAENARDEETAVSEEEIAEEEAPATEDDEIGSEKVSGSVGINAAKLARMLAAAKTRSQVQAVMELIQSDLRECDAGKEQGLDVDEASVKAAKSLLEEAKSRMSSAEDREPTPQEEMMSAIASLM